MSDTPWKDNGMTKEEKKNKIEKHFKEILKTLGMDLKDDSIKDTPKRMSKMYVDEIFSGLTKDSFPKITVIENKMGYSEPVTEYNITLNSTCEHHLVPILGVAHVSYVPKNKVIGLSKLNRIVDYYSKRPQVQERLTLQIANKLKEILETEDVAVVIDAAHSCVRMRGIRDSLSHTRTFHMSGIYNEAGSRSEFLSSVPKFEL